MEKCSSPGEPRLTSGSAGVAHAADLANDLFNEIRDLQSSLAQAQQAACTGISLTDSHGAPLSNVLSARLRTVGRSTKDMLRRATALQTAEEMRALVKAEVDRALTPQKQRVEELSASLARLNPLEGHVEMLLSLGQEMEDLREEVRRDMAALDSFCFGFYNNHGQKIDWLKSHIDPLLAAAQKARAALEAKGVGTSGETADKGRGAEGVGISSAEAQGVNVKLVEAHVRGGMRRVEKIFDASFKTHAAHLADLNARVEALQALQARQDEGPERAAVEAVLQSVQRQADDWADKLCECEAVVAELRMHVDDHASTASTQMTVVYQTLQALADRLEEDGRDGCTPTPTPTPTTPRANQAAPVIPAEATVSRVEMEQTVAALRAEYDAKLAHFGSEIVAHVRKQAAKAQAKALEKDRRERGRLPSVKEEEGDGVESLVTGAGEVENASHAQKVQNVQRERASPRAHTRENASMLTEGRSVRKGGRRVLGGLLVAVLAVGVGAVMRAQDGGSADAAQVWGGVTSKAVEAKAFSHQTFEKLQRRATQASHKAADVYGRTPTDVQAWTSTLMGYDVEDEGTGVLFSIGPALDERGNPLADTDTTVGLRVQPPSDKEDGGIGHVAHGDVAEEKGAERLDAGVQIGQQGRVAVDDGRVVPAVVLEEEEMQYVQVEVGEDGAVQEELWAHEAELLPTAPSSFDAAPHEGPLSDDDGAAVDELQLLLTDSPDGPSDPEAAPHTHEEEAVDGQASSDPAGSGVYHEQEAAAAVVAVVVSPEAEADTGRGVREEEDELPQNSGADVDNEPAAASDSDAEVEGQGQQPALDVEGADAETEGLGGHDVVSEAVDVTEAHHEAALEAVDVTEADKAEDGEGLRDREAASEVVYVTEAHEEVPLEAVGLFEDEHEVASEADDVPEADHEAASEAVGLFENGHEVPSEAVDFTVADHEVASEADDVSEDAQEVEGQGLGDDEAASEAMDISEDDDDEEDDMEGEEEDGDGAEVEEDDAVFFDDEAEEGQDDDEEVFP